MTSDYSPLPEDVPSGSRDTGSRGYLEIWYWFDTKALNASLLQLTFNSQDCEEGSIKWGTVLPSIPTILLEQWMRQPRVTLFWSLIISRSSSGQTFIHKWQAWQEKRLCPEGRAQTLSLKLSIMGWEELGLQRQMHLGSVELRQVLSLCALGFPICKVGDNYNCKVRVIVIW